MTFREEWFGDESQRALAELYQSVAGLEGDIIEIGSWEGRSTVALANAAHPQPVHAVDTWRGSPGEVSEILAAERDVYATFLDNVAGLNVIPHRMGWRDYFKIHRAPVKFVFIDAEHSYEEVRDNLTAVLPLMVPGGIVCGDDQHHPPVRRAVLERFSDAGVIATLWFAEAR